MKRQQVISRFFTPKSVAASPATPSPTASTSTASKPAGAKQSSSGSGTRPLVRIPPASLEPAGPVGGTLPSSRNLSQDFPFSSTGVRSTKKRSHNEVGSIEKDHCGTEGSQEERTLTSGWHSHTRFIAKNSN